MEVTCAAEDVQNSRVCGGGMLVIGAERAPREEFELLGRVKGSGTEDLEEERLR